VLITTIFALPPIVGIGAKKIIEVYSYFQTVGGVTAKIGKFNDLIDSKEEKASLSVFRRKRLRQ